ncbi:MAG: hypothetical protein H7Z17_11470 [Fuerstia sp.]|nr:hypothetical protein [Fuerstiella sp.]
MNSSRQIKAAITRRAAAVRDKRRFEPELFDAREINKDELQELRSLIDRKLKDAR